MARATESWINDTIPRGRSSASAIYIYIYIRYSYPMRRSKSNRKKGNREKKRKTRCGRSVSQCEADCSPRWNCSTETFRNNWSSFFARSGGRTPLVAFDNFIRHRSPYVPSPTVAGVYRSVTIYHWSAYIAILGQAYRQHRAHVRNGTERTFSADRELAETDRNSNVQIAEIIFHVYNMARRCCARTVCTNWNQSRKLGVS